MTHQGKTARDVRLGASHPSTRKQLLCWIGTKGQSIVLIVAPQVRARAGRQLGPPYIKGTVLQTIMVCEVAGGWRQNTLAPLDVSPGERPSRGGQPTRAYLPLPARRLPQVSRGVGKPFSWPYGRNVSHRRACWVLGGGPACLGSGGRGGEQADVEGGAGISVGGACQCWCHIAWPRRAARYLTLVCEQKRVEERRSPTWTMSHPKEVR